MAVFRGLMESLLLPPLDWIQVEASSACNAACTYCPRTAYREAWQSAHLPLETFERLLPALGRAGLVHLQGWGEPLLNPDLLAMVTMAKRSGCRVSTTTNGMLLGAEMSAALVETGVDIVAFSLAGVDEKNDLVRRGTSLDTVLANMRALAEEKARQGKHRPAIHVAYMLMRSGIADVERLPSLLQGLDVSQVVISTLDFVPSADLLDETIRPATMSAYHELRDRLDVIRIAGERSGLEIHCQLCRPGERQIDCSEHGRRAVFVSADGEVSPCTFTNMPVMPGFEMFRKGRHPYERSTFGNVNESSLAAIWQRRSYQRFRQSFERGPLHPSCQGCPKLFVTEI